VRTLSASQQRGVDHLADTPRSNLFMPPGLGKTATVMSALVDTMSLPAIVVAPKRVCTDVWPHEADHWRHLRGLRTSVITGTPAQRLAAMRRPAELYVVNPENMPWLLENEPPRPRAVIVDECAMMRGLRARQGTRNSAAINTLAAAVPRYHGLTGTPSTNGLDGLWGITFPVDQGKRLGTSYTAFYNRWFRFDANTYRTEALPHAFDEILERIRDVSPSILPPFELERPIEIPINVTMHARAQERYDEMSATMAIADYKVEAFDGAGKLNKLLQISAGAFYLDQMPIVMHEAKLDALAGIAAEHSGPLLVSYRYVFERDMMLQRFKHARVLDDTAVADWNAGKVPMLLVHPKSGGHGLNLQHGGHAIVHTTLPHDLELFEQVNARIGPMRQMQSGYKRPVFQFYLLASPVDRAVLRTLRTKCTLQEAVMAELSIEV